MVKKTQDLFEFIERAVKSRKYPETTAQGLRAALKLFDAELNDEERESLDLFKKNIAQIYHNVSVKNGKTYSAGSLAAYKSRVMKIIADYDKYGVDPTKMASWSPKIITRTPKKRGSNSSSGTTEEALETGPGSIVITGMNKIELALRPDKKAIIIVPEDMTPLESKKIKGILDSLTAEA